MANKSKANLKAQKASSSATCYAPLVVLPTSTTPEQLAELRAAGYVPVCCDNPEKVIVVLPQTRLAGDDLLMAALHGLESDGCTAPKQRFVTQLYQRLLKNEGA